MIWKRSILAVFVLLALGGVLPGFARAQELYLELHGLPGRESWTPDCSTWRELYPSFDVIRHQSSHEDNGDGVLSPCDYVFLDGERYHVDWVGPTYWLDCDYDGSEDRALEPLEWWEGDPSCQTWHELWPVFCQEYHVEYWMDGNGNSEADACDEVLIDETWCHVVSVGVNIHVTHEPVAARGSAWSAVKRLY